MKQCFFVCFWLFFSTLLWIKRPIRRLFSSRLIQEESKCLIKPLQPPDCQPGLKSRDTNRFIWANRTWISQFSPPMLPLCGGRNLIMDFRASHLLGWNLIWINNTSWVVFTLRLLRLSHRVAPFKEAFFSLKCGLLRGRVMHILERINISNLWLVSCSGRSHRIYSEPGCFWRWCIWTHDQWCFDVFWVFYQHLVGFMKL